MNFCSSLHVYLVHEIITLFIEHLNLQILAILP